MSRKEACDQLQKILTALGEAMEDLYKVIPDEMVEKLAACERTLEDAISNLSDDDTAEVDPS